MKQQGRVIARWVAVGVLGVAVILRVYSCQKSQEQGSDVPPRGVGSSSGQHSPTQAGDAVAAQLIEVPSEVDVCVENFRGKTDNWLAAKAYDQLEELADTVRSAKTQLPMGPWEITCFYDAFTPPESCEEKIWRNRMDELKQWTAARPQSITAHLCLAKFWIDYAWKARGSGYAHTVTSRGWDVMGERLEYAHEELAAAAPLKPRCPVFYDIMQNLALGQGWERESYDTVFSEAVAFEPNYSRYYRQKAYFLFPRWYGKTANEWMEFITASADRIGGDEGDILYARSALVGFGKMDSFLKDSGVAWPRLRHGLELLVQRYPDSLAAKTFLCYFSGQQGERQRAKELFQQIGDRVYTPIWNKDRFLEDRQWAMKD